MVSGDDLKNFLKNTPAYEITFRFRRYLAYLQWRRKRMGPVPGFVKARLIRKIQFENNLRVFIETGTFLGETLYAVRNCFDRLISIEIDNTLASKAKNRFKHWKKITIHCGDSGELLPSILDSFHEKILFWLDGHYSGGCTSHGKYDTPIEAELNAIVKHSIRSHVILIDDAHCFGRLKDYPELQFVQDLCVQNGYTDFRVENDIIIVKSRS